LALACALVIGGVGGLIGLGGGEFRLPVLVGLIGFAARAAVPINQTLSLMTLCTAFVVRWHRGLLVGVGAFAPAVLGLGIAGIVAAYFAVRLIAKVSDHRLERAIAILLMAIGLLLMGERLLPAGLPALVPHDPAWQFPVGILFGLAIGTVSTFLGVAGGELLIPTLILVFGATSGPPVRRRYSSLSQPSAWVSGATAGWASCRAGASWPGWDCRWASRALSAPPPAERLPDRRRPKY
jgi:uncharacterized membrane protein YfcA